MTYSATLVVHSFRAIIVLVAYYDLEYKQYDIVNTFLNSDLDKGNNKRRVYCRLLDRYKELGFLQDREDDTIVLELNKALYRLRESAL